jgi:DNA-binding NarL/FixJ family response regulator
MTVTATGPFAANDDPIRVLLVDDQRMFAESVGRLLANESDIDVVGVALTAEAAVELAASLTPDVAVVDFRLPDGDGASVTKKVLRISPATKVLILTGASDDELLLAAIEAGCSGILTKDRALAELVNAVRLASAGESYIPAQLLATLLQRVRGKRHGLGADLTARELEMLELVRAGTSTAEIAKQLYLSVNTVRNHIQNILTKLNAHSKLEAVAIATKEQLFDSR